MGLHAYFPSLLLTMLPKSSSCQRMHWLFILFKRITRREMSLWCTLASITCRMPLTSWYGAADPQEYKGHLMMVHNERHPLEERVDSLVRQLPQASYRSG